MVHDAEKLLLKMNAADYGDVVGIVAGTQKATGSTNFLRLHVVGADDGAGITHAQLAKRKERRKRRGIATAGETEAVGLFATETRRREENNSRNLLHS